MVPTGQWHPDLTKIKDRCRPISHIGWMKRLSIVAAAGVGLCIASLLALAVHSGAIRLPALVAEAARASRPDAPPVDDRDA